MSKPRSSSNSELVGYIRGVAKASDGKDQGQVSIGIDGSQIAPGAAIHSLKSSGEFVAGPFRAGTVTGVYSQRADGSLAQALVTATATAGQVTHLKLDAPAGGESLTTAQNQSILIGVGALPLRPWVEKTLTAMSFFPIEPRRWGDCYVL